MAEPAGTGPRAGSDADAAPDAAADALVRVGERFGRSVCWSAAEMAAFATAAGDANPLHHDAAHAEGTRFGAPIASGTQTVAAMMGAFATWFTRRDDGVERAAVGMEFRFALKAPVRAGETLRVDWEVVSREWKPRHGGWVVTARGTASTPSGVALEAEGTGLVLRAL